MGKCQALRIPGLADIPQTEFLDRCLISGLLFVIFCVIENGNIRAAVPRCAARKPCERRRSYFFGPLVAKQARVFLRCCGSAVKMHMMDPAMLALSANLHGYFFGLLRSRRRASQRKYFIGVFVVRFRGEIRPREALNRMLSR